MKIDPTNIDELVRFFEEHEGMTTGQMAQVVGRSGRAIRRWKHKIIDHFGVATPGAELRPPLFSPHHKRRANVERCLDPTIWDNKEWFYDQYVIKGRGCKLIGRILDKNYRRVWERLLFYRIPIRSVREATKSKNSCCNIEWLYKQYSTREQYVAWCRFNKEYPDDDGGKTLTVAECAKLAGVTPYSITEWLVRFDIDIRDKYEAPVIYKEKRGWYKSRAKKSDQSN